LLVAFVASAGAASAADSSEAVPVREPPTPEHVGAERRMLDLLAEARQLAKREEYAAAVRNYVQAFNYSRGVARLAVARLSILPMEMAALGERFPPALAALREETRIRAGLILTFVAGTDEIIEFVALNYALDQPRRILEMYDQLKSMGDRARDTRRLMRAVIGRELLDAGRYAELGDEAVAAARSIFAGLAELEALEGFDANESAARSGYLDARRAYFVTTGVRVTDALLAAARFDAARKLALRLVDASRDKAIVDALAEAATRAQQPDLARALRERGAAAGRP
jgi:hypothetical protein